MSGGVERQSGLTVEGLQKRYGKEAGLAIDDVTFTVPAGGFFTLLGPSGCGKTTTMRCVAGLERPNGGSIRIDGMQVSGAGKFLPTDRRPIGMVFQSYAIWPHLTVFENVAFPLRVSRPRTGGAELSRRVREALELVDLAHLEKRQATQLSGGQQQRIALARALVRRPSLLLLDEPLSNLDAKLRERLREEIRDLQQELGITTLYVTHDQAEALSMSDSIAVMETGRIAQVGTPKEIYQRPATAFVASFVGTSNFLPGTVAGRDGGMVLVAGEFGLLQVADTSTGAVAGGSATIAVRPESIVLRPVGDVRGGVNALRAVVVSAMFLGERVHCRVQIGDQQLTAYAEATSGLAPGHEVLVDIPPAACSLVQSDTTEVRENVQEDSEDRMLGAEARLGAAMDL